MGRKKGSKNKTKLLGDQVKEVTKAIGVKPCKGCNERAEKLNNAHLQFKRLFSNGKPLTEEELKQWQELKSRDNQNTLTSEQQKLIVDTLRNNLYLSVKPCVSCGIGKWNVWIEKIDNFIEFSKPE